MLNHIQLTEALNYFYLYGHWTITPLFFVWLYKRRRRVYPYVRNAFLVANAIALSVFMVYPVAPPRLAATGDGLVDTLNHISDIDLHGGVFSGWFNPHAAVPSMHFGYAVMIGMVGLVLLRSWPLRLLAVAYPAVVFVTITGTANHYVLDSVAGGLVVGDRLRRGVGLDVGPRHAATRAQPDPPNPLAGAAGAHPPRGCRPHRADTVVDNVLERVDNPGYMDTRTNGLRA